MGFGCVRSVRLRDLPVVLFGSMVAAARRSLVSWAVGIPVTVAECRTEGRMPVVNVFWTLAPCFLRVWNLGILRRFCLSFSLITLNFIGLPEA